MEIDRDVTIVSSFFWGEGRVIFGLEVSNRSIAKSSFHPRRKITGGSSVYVHVLLMKYFDWCQNLKKSWLFIVDNADDPDFYCQSYSFHPGIGETIILTSRVVGCSRYETIGPEKLARPRSERVCGACSQSSGNSNGERTFAKSSPALFLFVGGDCRPPRFGFGRATPFFRRFELLQFLLIILKRNEHLFLFLVSGWLARFFVHCICSSLPAERVYSVITVLSRSNSYIYRPYRSTTRALIPSLRGAFTLG